MSDNPLDTQNNTKHNYIVKGHETMDYNQLAKDLISELKTHARRSDREIAERLGISRQAYVRRVNSNTLTTENITVLSAWLVTAFGGGFYLNKYLGENK